MKKLTVAMAVVAATALGTAELSAQVSDQGQASVTIPQVLVVTGVGDLAIGAGEFDFSAADSDAGTGTVSVGTRSNIQHAIEVTGTDLTLAGSSALTLDVLDGSSNVVGSVGTTPVQAAAGLARGSRSTVITFQATASVLDHGPGEYTGTITYTVVADN